MAVDVSEKGGEMTELIRKMFSVGAHLGFSRSRRHPSAEPYVFGLKNRTEIFDLEKTSELLESAKTYLFEVGKARGTIVIVGGKNEAREIVTRIAEAAKLPFVAGRWIGGTLTNFSEIKKRLARLAELKEGKEKGLFAGKYTKREILMFEREMEDLKATFGGLTTLEKTPAALVIVDPRAESIAREEARKMKIPVVALMSSDCNVKDVEYPVVGNDSAIRSIEFFLSELVHAYEEGFRNAASPTPEAQQPSL